MGPDVDTAPGAAGQGDEPVWWKPVVAFVVVVPIVVVVFALMNQRPTPPAITASPVTASSSPTSSSSTSASASPTVGPDHPPTIKNLRHANFAAGHGLPDGAHFYNVGTSTPGISLTGGVLTHGAPVSGGGAGYLETNIGSKVRKIGVRVKFATGAPADDGGVAITAWQDSVEQSLGDRKGLPPSGMRLVIRNGSWSLVTIDNKKVTLVKRGAYKTDSGTRPQRFLLTRSKDQLWLRDPEGQLTYLTSAPAASLAGPWVSWELYERAAGDKPASITDVWAG